MVTAIILAGGTGVRMKNAGLPKQFLPLYGKPIICYTLETFEECDGIDQIVIPCNKDWIGHMESLVNKFNFKKVTKIVAGGKDRQSSIAAGLNTLTDVQSEDLVMIHDGVRPLVSMETLQENIRVAREHGNAMTVKQNVETVVVTEQDDAVFEDFKNRNNTYTLTSPQTFHVEQLREMFRKAENAHSGDVPILDASLLFAYFGVKIHLVKETGLNLKITTPEDFYYLRSYIELNESKAILGI